jgi:hypothetical protein
MTDRRGYDPMGLDCVPALGLDDLAERIGQDDLGTWVAEGAATPNDVMTATTLAALASWYRTERTSRAFTGHLLQHILAPSYFHTCEVLPNG